VPLSGENELVDPSSFGRECLLLRLATAENLNFTALSIRRTIEDGELQPPCVYLDDKEALFDISLSHDGKYTAYAFIKLI
jgi:hypothetical protein